jgi:hypothetical protein
MREIIDKNDTVSPSFHDSFLISKIHMTGTTFALKGYCVEF